jgi:radical SAM protein with 4Fe4S-binding SPASM domain
MNNKIRRGSNFDSICAALRKIVVYKKKHNISYPYMNFVFAAMKSNLHQIPDLVRLAAEIGLEEVKIVYLTAFGRDMLEESLYNCQDEVKKVFDEAAAVSKTLGVNIKLPYIQGEDIAGDRLHKDCYVSWRDFFLGSDGFVRPCMSTPVKLFKMKKFTHFKELWNCAEYKTFRKIINNDKEMSASCQICYQSSYTNWNKKESFIQIGEEFAPEWEK